ncbi:beta-3-deoxy-D-manno-oct-2-ulosonic acid transferase [Novosphingobium sp.]|uniref:capsular polysaccharide export protein, LipB/KpsS family n=1 Tax=Novosphingobium sp. TaxID=1874826 RepID=UPI002B45EFCC|nr:beta-3-deoxy-D-manno-oct-2-ulosonic acid transferase [Novosphingobium sp.]
MPTEPTEPAINARSIDELAACLVRWRVGGNFWGASPDLPRRRDVVLCPSNAAALPHLIAAAREAGVIDRAVVRGRFGRSAGVPCIGANIDPWDLCARVALVIADGADEAALVARLIGTQLQIVGGGSFAALADVDGLKQVLRTEVIARWRYRDPFYGGSITAAEVIALLGKWRLLIEANRPITAVYGVARWKRVTADALLWDGIRSVPHARAGGRLRSRPAKGSRVVAWIARTDAQAMANLAESGVSVGEIEDGMVRSTGLGANCVPPLSIIVDAAGPHFDPGQASELENILQTAEFDDELLQRAAHLRATLVEAGITKYGMDEAGAVQSPGILRRRTVLVTGQVEDDRSVQLGGAGLDNLSLLRRARHVEPDAWIVFKPHPDVEAGHRTGHVPDARALEWADEIDRTSSIIALLRSVDAVHVLTSLAGFEALMRGCEVITHGVPFYAGWGLTRDLGPVPARRTRRRTLDELVAATLILYPRYVDPVTRLPCEPELLVERIAQGRGQVRSSLIVLRELQGQLKRRLQRSETR